MNVVMLSVLAFIAVAGLIGAISFLFAKPTVTRAGERLDVIVGRNSRSESSSELLLRRAMMEVDRKNILDRLTPEFFNFTKIFQQADVKFRPSILFGVSLGLALVGGMISSVMINIYFAPVGGLIFFVLPFVWLLWKRKSRLARFASQLPDAMELIARALRAGHSLAAGLHVVADELPEPISKEFNRVYEEQNLGIPLEEALKNLCDRVPNLDLRFFVTSVVIQRQTGGDLAEILDRIGYIIRERFKILGQVKALTAEGRLSGIVLIALPIGLFLMMLHMKPDYVSLLWTDPMGVKMSIAAVVLMLIGAYAIKKIVDIKV
jgi:tight adherence protein B